MTSSFLSCTLLPATMHRRVLSMSWTVLSIRRAVASQPTSCVAPTNAFFAFRLCWRWPVNDVPIGVKTTVGTGSLPRVSRNLLRYFQPAFSDMHTRSTPSGLAPATFAW